MLDPEQFEEIRRKLEATYNEAVSGRRIRGLRVNSSYRWQPPLHMEVGKYCSHLSPDGPPELVLAIYESRSFLVCTPEHGIKQGSPYIFTRADVKGVIDAD
jgi:hypothetical protein